MKIRLLPSDICRSSPIINSPRFWRVGECSFPFTAIWQALQEHDGKDWKTKEELLPSGHQAPKHKLCLIKKIIIIAVCTSLSSLLFIVLFIKSQSHIERELRQLHSLQWNVFFTAMTARGASQKFPEVAANTCSAIEMQQNKQFATHF